MFVERERVNMCMYITLRESVKRGKVVIDDGASSSTMMV